MKQLTGNQVRQMFLDYFESKGHMVEPGASLVPVNDPTLLWINAGVAALKKYFDGSEKPRCNRITNAQKSIRTNDIENVGKTARHHTFFEMLGNFSIGDYFKEEAIPFAWEFLTSPEWIGFDKDKMYVTIYPDDNDAYRIWTEVCKVDPSHILKTYDNFWQIGEGPSGPDSEIFYDRGEEYDPEGLGERLFFEEMENDRYIEVWNVVFSQYDAKEGIDRKDFKELPQKNIDTGMGLERLVALIQGGETNFDTDLFLPIIHATEKMAKYPYSGEYKMAYRVIADHIRTVTFALSDGANFSNEGRGYVLRRVLRRAVRYGIKLGIDGSFMYQLVQVVADNMKEFYPYLQEKVGFVSTLVRKEEEAFHATLTNGEKLLQEALNNATLKVLKGEVIFKLYDTYGFPKELTAEIAEDAGFTVDMDGFNACMQQQRERARDARDAVESMASQSQDLMDYVEPFEFTGYSETKTVAVCKGLFKDGHKVDVITDEGDIIFDKSCFYAESGGQVADTGIIYNDNCRLECSDVKKAPHKQFIHHVKVIEGKVSLNDQFTLEIDNNRREKIKANHSCVHLMQSALKQVVGNHIAQAGSFVNDEYARFDFTHFEKVTVEQLKEVELLVNKYISDKLPVITEVLSIEDAKKTGAIALFDEKYGDSVRVVSMGDISKEFCGGTHVSNTSALGVFKIDFEESIGSGIRRIQARTSLEAYKEFVSIKELLDTCASKFKMTSVNGIENKIQNVLDENNALKKELAKLNEQMMMLQANEIVEKAENINGINCIFLTLNDFDASKLKSFGETLRNKKQDSFVFIINKTDKLTFVCASSKKAIEQGLKAGQMVKIAASIADGKGGGRDDIAQAGGKDISKIDEIFKAIKEQIKA